MKLGLYHAGPQRLGCDCVHWPTATFITANQPSPVLPSFHPSTTHPETDIVLLTALRLREEIVRLDVDARVARLFVSKQSRSFRSKFAVRSMLMELSSIDLGEYASAFIFCHSIFKDWQRVTEIPRDRSSRL